MEIVTQYGWLVVFVLAIVIEGMSLALTSMWFAAGALAAWLVSFVTTSMEIQILVFLLVSLGLLLGLRPFAVKKLKIGRHRTNADALVGKVGVVIKAIEPLTATGQVKVGAQIWTAVSQESLKEDEKVEVLDIQGVKLVVKKAEQSARAEKEEK
jgi:membrane protein implicated in regulation of membrane protease activity